MNNETLTQIKQLAAEGLSNYKIAERVGYSDGTVAYWLNKEKIRPTEPRNFLAADYDSKTEHTCHICKETKPIAEFGKKKSRGKYVEYLVLSYCKKCDKEQYANRRIVRKSPSTLDRKKFAVDYKGGNCSICGYNKCPSAMDFHHVDPKTKEYEISSLIRSKSNDEILLKELDKCILLCSNCHREYHAGYTELPS
jgi:hypothetical protein